MDSKRVYRIIGYNVLYVVGSLLMYYPFDMKSTGLSFCAVGLTLINLYYFLEWKEDAQKEKFVQKYKAVHQRSLSKTTINYKETYIVSSSMLAMMIFGSIICFSGIGMFYEKSIFGVFVLFIGGKFLLIPFTEKTTIKLAPNGIYMSDYQFVFINDIQEINFKRHLGKSTCKMFLKIKDPALYGLKDSHIAVPIGGDMRQVEQLITLMKKLFSNTRISQDI